MSAPKNANRKHHYHAQSVLKQWLPNGQSKLRLYDLDSGNIRQELPSDVCMVPDLYTQPEMSAAARGHARAGADSSYDQLKSRGDETTLLDRLAEHGGAPTSAAQRRKVNEVDIFGPIDSKAAEAFAALRKNDQLKPSQLEDVARYLLASHRRSPAGWAEAPAVMENVFEDVVKKHGLDALQPAWGTVQDAVFESAAATVPGRAQNRDFHSGPTRHYAMRVLRIGDDGPAFIFSDNSGQPWSGLHDVGGRPVLHCEGPPRITYPIAPGVAVELRTEGADEVAFSLEETVLQDHEVHVINIALTLAANDVIVLPDQAHAELFPSKAPLRSLRKTMWVPQ